METKKKQKESVNVADLINGGIINNLADVDWEEATRGWDNDKAKEIIDKVNDRNLRPFIIDAMISEWNYKGRMGRVSVLGISFESFLNAYKEHTLNYELFNIDIIREKINQELAQMKKDIKELKEKVFAVPDELKTDEAKKWLQVAIDGGLLNSDYSPTDKTKTNAQKALLAEILSEKIGLEHKYRPFEKLWNVSWLSKQRYKSIEEKGTVKGGDVIMEVFKVK